MDGKTDVLDSAGLSSPYPGYVPTYDPDNKSHASAAADAFGFLTDDVASARRSGSAAPASGPSLLFPASGLCPYQPPDPFQQLADTYTKDKRLNTDASQAEVDGVPARQTSRKEDDGSNVAVMETEHAAKYGYSNDKKKRTSIKDATHTVTRTTSNESTEDDVHDRTTKTTTAKGNWKDQSGSITHVVNKEHVADQGGDHADVVGTTASTTRGINGSARGASVTWGSERGEKAGSSSTSSGHTVNAGVDWKTQHVVVEAGRKQTSSAVDSFGSDVTNTSTQSAGWKNGELTFGKSDTMTRTNHETVGGAETDRKVTRATSASVGFGQNSASIAGSHTNAAGTTHAASGSVKVNGSGDASITGHHTVTDADGNSLTTSVHAGTTVQCDEVREQNGRFFVTYRRTRSGGAELGGAHSGVGVTGGVSHDSFDVGTRSFATKDEADAFKRNAAMLIPHDAPDIDTATGAKAMAVGEELGHGSSDTKSLGGSASYGTGGLSLQGTMSSTGQKTVRRISENLFEVTVSRGTNKGGDVTGSGASIKLNKGSSHSTNSAETYAFDLSTADGQRAYQTYMDTGVAPAGTKPVSSTTGVADEHHDAVSLLWGQHEDVISRDNWEQTTKDETDSYKEFGGRTSHKIKPGWFAKHLFGDKALNESFAVMGYQKDDNVDRYRVEGHFGGESGATTRRDLARLTSDYDDHGATNERSSGEWTVSAEVDPAAVNKMERSLSRFDRLHSNDARMRALSELVEDEGAHVAQGIEYEGDKHIAWDVELKGDRNFPGEAGRLEHEAKLQMYGALMKASIQSPDAVVHGLQKEIDGLEARRQSVADEKRYPDLPQKLRQQQLSLIDEQVAQLAAIRHAGLLEMTKNHVGEDAATVAQRASDQHGYDKLPPEQRDIAKLRDQITLADSALTGYERDNMTARREVGYAMNHFTDPSKARAAGAEIRDDMHDKYELGRLSDDIHRRASIGEIDQLRTRFLASMNDPAAARALGQQLLSRLEAERAREAQAAGTLRDAARIQDKLDTDAARTGTHGAYWNDVASENEDEGFQLPTRNDAPEGTRTSMALPHVSKHAKKGMSNE